MNIYLCYGGMIYDTSDVIPEDILWFDLVAAETPGKAKSLFLNAATIYMYTGSYTSIKATKLCESNNLPPGVVPDSMDGLWRLASPIVDRYRAVEKALE